MVPPEQAWRILVVEANRVLRAGIAALVEAAPGMTVCGEGDDASQTIALVTRHRPDLTVCDPFQTTGLELLREIVAAAGKVLVCTTQEEDLWAERTIKAGARGFMNVLHDPDPTGAVRHILDGGIHLSQTLTSRMLGKLITGAETTPLEPLSNRELEVFHRIGQGQGTRDIAEALALSIKTIETYRNRIKKKLGLKSGTNLLHKAIEWTALQRSPYEPEDPHDRIPPPPSLCEVPHHLVSSLLAAPVELRRNATNVVGRDGSAAVHINSELVSRRHAEIRWDDQRGFLISDLESSNGTSLNDVPLRKPCSLHHGDRIQFGGGLHVHVQVGDPSEFAPLDENGPTRTINLGG